MDNKVVFIVMYKDNDYDEPVVTVFDSEDTANKCYECFKATHDSVWLDVCPLYSKFTIGK